MVQADVSVFPLEVNRLRSLVDRVPPEDSKGVFQLIP
jgi:hypothetical protein